MGWTKPKCLLSVGDTALLDNILEALSSRGIDEVVIVVGFEHALVEQAAAAHSLRCRFVRNADYAATNTIHSLYLAREHLSDGFLCFNADVWFEHGVLDLLLGRGEARGGEGHSRLVVDAKRCGAEEVKVIVEANRRITRIGKDLPPEDCMGEFIGIARFDRGAVSALIDALRRYNERRGGRNLFFEAAVDDILADHVFEAVPLGLRRAVEIDTSEDYDRAGRLTMEP